MTTVAQLKNALPDYLTHFNGTDEALEREVTGGYCGDLLSWVMGRAQAGQAWVTIMNNPNVAAVAQLTDVACVILAEGVNPDENLLRRAKLEDLPIFGSHLSAYDLCWRVQAALDRHEVSGA